MESKTSNELINRQIGAEVLGKSYRLRRGVMTRETQLEGNTRLFRTKNYWCYYVDGRFIASMSDEDTVILDYLALNHTDEYFDLLEVTVDTSNLDKEPEQSDSIKTSED